MCGQIKMYFRLLPPEAILISPNVNLPRRFQFSDVVLLTCPRFLSNPLGMGPRTSCSYRLRARFAVDNVQVLEGDNLVTPNTFYLQDETKSIELYTEYKTKTTMQNNFE